MPTRILPPSPNLAQLKRQANELRRSHRNGDPSAAARVLAHHSRLNSQAPPGEPLVLADAQRVIAREYAFESWGKLKHHVETAKRVASFRAHPRFGEALATLDVGNLSGLAMLFAYVREQPAAVDFLLEKDGNWNMIGVNNGTALHRAAGSGDVVMVERLVAKGADISDRNNPFIATPFSWADHARQADVCRWMRAHCAIDLHDAVCFDLREHVDARLREDVASVDSRRDQWDIPQGTPLHWAARLNRVELAELLLEKGADPNIVAGNGCTPLDLVEVRGGEVCNLIER